MEHNNAYLLFSSFRQFFLDAIPMLGNTASVHMIKNFIVDKTVTGVESDAWLTSLAFIREPTAEMLREVKVGVWNLCIHYQNLAVSVLHTYNQIRAVLFISILSVIVTRQ